MRDLFTLSGICSRCRPQIRQQADRSVKIQGTKRASKLIGNDQKALSCGLVIVSGRSFSA